MNKIEKKHHGALAGDQLVDTGKRMVLPGHPASMRGRAR
jgi:hypothetical protein